MGGGRRDHVYKNNDHPSRGGRTKNNKIKNNEEIGSTIRVIIIFSKPKYCLEIQNIRYNLCCQRSFTIQQLVIKTLIVLILWPSFYRTAVRMENQ